MSATKTRPAVARPAARPAPTPIGVSTIFAALAEKRDSAATRLAARSAAFGNLVATGARPHHFSYYAGDLVRLYEAASVCGDAIDFLASSTLAPVERFTALVRHFELARLNHADNFGSALSCTCPWDRAIAETTGKARSEALRDLANLLLPGVVIGVFDDLTDVVPAVA